jgi:DNA-directed RNA polymerase specialized sigma24 family protein
MIAMAGTPNDLLRAYLEEPSDDAMDRLAEATLALAAKLIRELRRNLPISPTEDVEQLVVDCAWKALEPVIQGKVKAQGFGGFIYSACRFGILSLSRRIYGRSDRPKKPRPRTVLIDRAKLEYTPPEDPPDVAPLFSLDMTPRERNVLETMLHTDSCVKDVADALGLGRGTISTHLHRIRRKAKELRRER